MQTPCFSLWRAVSRNRRLCAMLRAVSHLAVVGAGAALVLTLWAVGREALFTAPLMLAVLGVGFCSVSVWRQAHSAARPYEDHPELFPVPPKEKEAHSFPSRHAFSAFAIGTAALAASPWISLCMLALALVQAVCRVALGIHYIKDVAAGGAVGVLTGLVAWATCALA